ncbi:MAG: hypothetical protein EOO36_02045 [Cytophagaceae bacterium]|nr:MAG: hypothetical protein EOO36_02045 [Cytophagaceae bacterium]
MRVLILLFALYFAGLGCLPCPDAEPCAEPAQTAVFRAPDPSGSHSLGDWCSPLCQCPCCAGVALPQPLLRVAFGERPMVAYATRRYAGRPRLAVPTRAPAAPWQPPQGA